MKQAFLILSTLSLVITILPYLRDVVRQKTKPRIVSWFNWGLLTGIATAAAIQAEQYPSAVLTAVSTVCVMAVAILGFRHGKRDFELLDIVCQIGAIIGLVLWIIFSSPLVAIAVTVAIDLIAGLPTLKHAWQKPQEETAITFMGGILGGAFSLAAIDSYHFSGVIYPAYLMFANIILFSVIVTRRHGR